MVARLARRAHVGRGWLIPLWGTAALAALAAVAAVGAGCGTDATGVEACRQIEDARCRRAPGCGIAIEPPYSTMGSAVDACIRFYDTACLHGLESSDPGPVVVGQCVAAIRDGGCTIVASPEKSPACAWLSPTPLPEAAPADVVEAEADGGTDSTD